MKILIPALATALAGFQPATAQDRMPAAETQQPRAARPAAPPVAARPLRRTVPEPLVLGPPPPAPPLPRLDALPVPNRSIEPPRDRFADDRRPVWEPFVLPPERRQGQTFGREHLRETGPDRPFDQIVPGARLRIPLE
jgi:hypothetical protein